MNKIIDIRSELYLIIRKWPIGLGLFLAGCILGGILGISNRTIITLDDNSREKLESYLYHYWQQNIVWEEYDTTVLDKVGILAASKGDVATINEEVLQISRWKDAVDSMNSVVYTEYDLLNSNEKTYVRNFNTLIAAGGVELKDMTESEVTSKIHELLSQKAEPLSMAQVAVRKGIQMGVLLVALFIVLIVIWSTFNKNVSSAEELEYLTRAYKNRGAEILLKTGKRSLLTGKAITDYPAEGGAVLHAYACITSSAQLRQKLEQLLQEKVEEITIYYID